MGASATNLRRSRPGIDSVVATMMVVAVTVVASLAVSGFVFGALGKSQIVARVAVTGTALPASDFTAGGLNTNATCSTLSSAAYITLTNTGTGRATLAGITITWAGGKNAYTISGSCSVGTSGSADSTQFVVFPPTTQMTPSAITGQTYTGTITLSNGARLLFTSTWQ